LEHAFRRFDVATKHYGQHLPINSSFISSLSLHFITFSMPNSNLSIVDGDGYYRLTGDSMEDVIALSLPALMGKLTRHSTGWREVRVNLIKKVALTSGTAGTQRGKGSWPELRN